jgi:hypothetical protein
MDECPDLFGMDVEGKCRSVFKVLFSIYLQEVKRFRTNIGIMDI